MNRLLALALILWASGCGPTLTAQSAPPPGRIAALDADGDRYHLDLSSGVAIAISCYHDGPCKDVVISTEDESIAGVKGASFGTVERNPYAYATAVPAGVVVIGRAPGKTRVKVKTRDGSRTIHVTVVPPPRQGEHATAVAR